MIKFILILLFIGLCGCQGKKPIEDKPVPMVYLGKFDSIQGWVDAYNKQKLQYPRNSGFYKPDCDYSFCDVLVMSKDGMYKRERFDTEEWYQEAKRGHAHKCYCTPWQKAIAKLLLDKKINWDTSLILEGRVKRNTKVGGTGSYLYGYASSAAWRRWEEDKMIEETLVYSDYEICETRKSKIDPNREHTICTGFKCPHCKKQHKKLRHEESVECKCGLEMQVFGNALDCKLPIREKINESSNR